MSPEQQRIKIAEACPFVKKATTDSPLEYDYSWFDKRGHAQRFDPLNDLNAMHEAEKVLSPDQGYEYATHLAVMGTGWSATAAQRAEAFLKCLGLWKEEPVSAATVEGLR